MSDIAENQLFALIGEKKIEAIRLFLQTHNARYSNKLELSGTVTTKDDSSHERTEATYSRSFAALNATSPWRKETIESNKV
jgi:hypothetical protein